MKMGPREIGVVAEAAAFLVAAVLAVTPVVAQQVTGELGSPSATTTINGKQLPPPPPQFGGVIKQSALDSKPWWPPRIVPPKGAPNVLLIMTDDQGYGVTGTLVVSTRHRRWIASPMRVCAIRSSTPLLFARPRVQRWAVTKTEFIAFQKAA
jgi:hypothetical protein